MLFILFSKPSNFFKFLGLVENYTMELENEKLNQDSPDSIFSHEFSSVSLLHLSIYESYKSSINKENASSIIYIISIVQIPFMLITHDYLNK